MEDFLISEFGSPPPQLKNNKLLHSYIFVRNYVSLYVLHMNL